MASDNDLGPVWSTILIIMSCAVIVAYCIMIITTYRDACRRSGAWLQRNYHHFTSGCAFATNVLICIAICIHWAAGAK